jgi:uncharacterized protein with von Willebrand factor type A (vWA) domain
VRFLYSQWDDALMRQLKDMKSLMAIFNYLLLQVNGNVKLALKLLRQLQKMGIVPAEYDIDRFEKELEKEGVVRWNHSGPSLTRKGERTLRRNAFEQIFEHLKRSGPGDHKTAFGGGDSAEQLEEKRPYVYGDDLASLDLSGSLHNAIIRSGSLGLNLSEDDLEVRDSAMNTSTATVVLLDISHSMILYGEDRITPAKQVAMAFAEMIMTRYPHDCLNIVLFGDDAREVQVKDLPYVAVGPYMTNTKAGLQMARNILLRRKNANKQIFMITDGKPSMIVRDNGRVYKNPVGLDPVIVNRTLDEAIICRKKKIPITTFMITDDPYLQEFVRKLTELNRGRAYFSSASNLGSYIFYDFMNHRRKNR